MVCLKRGETRAEFQYSDSGDKLTQQLIGREFDYIYWGKSEEGVLRRGKAFLAAHFGAERLKTLSMLDLGCGMGRLIPEFAALTGDVTGLEPDRERCRMAADFLRDRGVENAQVYHMDLGTYLDSLPELPRFDVVLCSHIFQHFSHATFAGILRDLQRCTGKETVFLFTTTFAPTEDNQYTFERFDGGVRTVTPTDPEGFERAVEEPETLAVCLFSRQWMTDFLAKGGLRVADFAAYHFQNEHDAERDPADNEDPEKLKEARDAFYICLPFEVGRTGEDQAHIPVAAGKISFMQFYNLEEGPIDLSSAQAAEASQKPDPGRDRVRQDFKTAEDFLYGGNLHFPARRFFFTDCIVGLGDIPISASHAVVSAYPESGICQVTVCLQVEETSIQNFVYLHQIQCGETAPFTVNGEPCAIPTLCERLMARCGLKTRSKGPTSIITEINRLDGRDSYGPLTDNECRCLYGALTGDEGWAHVPVELARGRIDNSWTSRDFVRAIVFSSNYLLLNLNRDSRYEEYLRWQHGYADHYFGGLNDYFTMDAATAGLNHGLFLSVETGMLIKATADRLLDRKPDLTRHTGFFLREEIRKNKRYRREMIETLNKVEMVNISELGELDALIVRSLGVTQKIDSIRGLLELLESDLDLAYQTKTNQMVNLLTILSVGLAAVQVILALIAM